MSIIAMLLHEPAATQVREWWGILQKDLHIAGVRAKVPFPHVTLLGCEGIEHPRIQAILTEYTHRIAPFSLRSLGLGLFLKPLPVLYTPIIRTPALSKLHQDLWIDVERLGGTMFKLYSPDHWIPHLTLAQGDLTTSNLREAFQALKEHHIALEFQVRNLTLFNYIGPRYEPQERYPLLGASSPALPDSNAISHGMLDSGPG